MLRFIRHMIDVNRLHKEIERLEDENRKLKAELSSVLMGPIYREVAKDFDATALLNIVGEQVVSDLSPLLEQDAIKMLKQGMRALQRERAYYMTGSVAGEVMSHVYEVEFTIQSMGTRLRVAHF